MRNEKLEQKDLEQKEKDLEKLIEAQDAETKALADIDNYVSEVCGGWL